MTHRTGEEMGSVRATRSARSLAQSAASRRRAQGAMRTRSACQRPGSSGASRRSATTHRLLPGARVAQRSPPCALSDHRRKRPDQRTPALRPSHRTAEPRASVGDASSTLRTRDKPGHDATASSRPGDEPSSDPVGTHHEHASARGQPRPRPAGPQHSSTSRPAATARATPRPLRSVFTRSDEPPGCLARRDHLHADAGSARGAIEPKPGRPGLIASPHRARQTQRPRDRLLDARPEPGAQKLTHRDVKSPRHASSGHGHQAPHKSPFRSWPDLLTDTGVSRSHSPARQTPTKSVRPTSHSQPNRATTP